MAGEDDERFGSEEPTQPLGHADLANALRNVGLSLHEIVRDLSESARLVENLAPYARRSILVALAEKMEELGGIAGDASRVLREIAEM